MRRMFLGINYLVLIAAFAALFYVAWPLPLSGTMRVAELDRHGVFDEDKLREYSPELAENLRHNVGMWVEEDALSMATLLAWGLFVLSLLNVIVLHRLGRPQAAQTHGSAAMPPPEEGRRRKTLRSEAYAALGVVTLVVSMVGLPMSAHDLLYGAFMVVVAVLVGLALFFRYREKRAGKPTLSRWFVGLLIGVLIFAVVCALAIFFRWSM